MQYLAGKFNDEMKVLSDDLARGAAKDYGDYKYACGIIRGLMIANAVLADVTVQMEKDEDDDDDLA
ncbi:MAG: hypothetical protein DDT25_00134 [Chloroflexi bacterium]|nr:hypothetical protein [Chloroflexota bacterium]